MDRSCRGQRHRRPGRRPRRLPRPTHPVESGIDFAGGRLGRRVCVDHARARVVHDARPLVAAGEREERDRCAAGRPRGADRNAARTARTVRCKSTWESHRLGPFFGWWTDRGGAHTPPGQARRRGTWARSPDSSGSWARSGGLAVTAMRAYGGEIEGKRERGSVETRSWSGPQVRALEAAKIGAPSTAGGLGLW